MRNDLSHLGITQADTNDHLMSISQITADAFAGGQYVDEISCQYIGNCHYDWDTSRLIWDGDRLVHHWGVWGYPMRLESVHLKVAGIGAVTTRERYRKQGLMQRAATDSIAAMHQNGYDLSILRGRHYVKYGYVRAWNYVTYRLKPDEIPDTALANPFELLGLDRMDEINSRYNQDYQGYSGTCVRPTYSMLDADNMKAYGWYDGEGNLAGYVCAVPTDDKKKPAVPGGYGRPHAGAGGVAEIVQVGGIRIADLFHVAAPAPHLADSAAWRMHR